ncbi:restriction endonuclease subunit S [Pseudomonas sp. 35 E 8]|uniref:restriction endonuclease subunit S n=1 Tax=Pseudomonas sp. 35 E 8 TaxID=1844103 RepID=UPI000811ED17|nr:restriction endonuclease subunit S [Pseudomonas sp. 35 E 8]CRM47744.1 Type I restriction modification DNA specificity domain protein [Pseudomonas sp. 35 E 8]
MSSKIKTNSTIENSKPALVPKLRFPEFREAAGWRYIPLNHLALRAKQKNRDKKIDRVLTNSAEFGVVDQRDFFDKDIATQGKLEGYFVVELGSYVYNPRISSTAPVGPISKNKIGTGVMSPLYTVFKFKDERNDFYEYFFKTTGWHTYMRHASSTGARHDRMAISSDDFLAMPLPASSSDEQQKIADCLNSLDELIATQCRKVNTLKSHKKGLMHQLFPREGEIQSSLRFPDFRESWVEIKLDSLSISISSGRDKLDPEGDIDLYGSTSVIGKTRTPSFSGERILIARVGANAGLLTKAKGTFGVTDNTIVVSLKPSINIDFVFYYLESTNINRLIFGSGQPLITGSILKNLPIMVPSDLEQRKISACLSSLDDLIANQSLKLEAMKAHKLGLMQQLFPLLAEIDA